MPGYPAGVPREDYVALAGVLHRTPHGRRVDQPAEELDRNGEASEAAIADLIRRRIHERADASDIARVSARLAQGGWPLAAPASVAESLGVRGRPSPADRRLAARGIPDGRAPEDFILSSPARRRRLTDAEVKQVAKSLRHAGIAPAGPVEIGAEITRVTNELPSGRTSAASMTGSPRRAGPLDFPDPENPDH